MFRYCGYWHSWTRVLSENHPKGPCIEVNLTPIPNCYSSTWANDVAPIRIRAKGLSSGDKMADQLPEDVKRAMVRNLGAELTERLLTEDFLPQIDWNIYERKCNGGANLEDIRLR